MDFVFNIKFRIKLFLNNRDHNVNCMHNSFRGLLHLLLELTQRTLNKGYTYDMISLPNVFRICLVISLRAAVHWPGFLIFWLWVYLMKFMPNCRIVHHFHQYQQSEQSPLIFWYLLLIKIMCPSGATYPLADCWFSALAQQRSNKALGSSTKITPPWVHWT